MGRVATAKPSRGKGHRASFIPLSLRGNTRFVEYNSGKRMLMCVSLQPTESFSLINDPRNDYGRLYTVDKLGNVWGGRPVLCGSFCFTQIF